jgi:Asp-tRNA(Asn)/Glu-tRNA(Gln) amidotransferase A subunit family amidase
MPVISHPYLSPHQDTVGPLARCVADAALLLSVIVGNDPGDTCDIGLPAPQEWPDYTTALNAGALRGKRLGVPRALFQDQSIINGEQWDECWLCSADTWHIPLHIFGCKVTRHFS